MCTTHTKQEKSKVLEGKGEKPQERRPGYPFGKNIRGEKQVGIRTGVFDQLRSVPALQPHFRFGEGIMAQQMDGDSVRAASTRRELSRADACLWTNTQVEKGCSLSVWWCTETLLALFSFFLVEKKRYGTTARVRG